METTHQECPTPEVKGRDVRPDPCRETSLSETSHDQIAVTGPQCVRSKASHEAASTGRENQ